MFIVKKIKNTVPWIYVISDLNVEEIVGSFYEKELPKKTNQKEFRIEKLLKTKRNKLYVKWKGYEILGLIKVESDLSSYATKTDLKNVAHLDVSSIASKINLASLKTEVDNLDIDKLTPVPYDLAKLNNVVKNVVVKKLNITN